MTPQQGKSIEVYLLYFRESGVRQLFSVYSNKTQAEAALRRCQDEAAPYDVWLIETRDTVPHDDNCKETPTHK